MSFSYFTPLLLSGFYRAERGCDQTLGPPDDIQGGQSPFSEVLFEPVVRLALVGPARAQRNIRHC